MSGKSHLFDHFSRHSRLSSTKLGHPTEHDRVTFGSRPTTLRSSSTDEAFGRSPIQHSPPAALYYDAAPDKRPPDPWSHVSEPPNCEIPPGVWSSTPAVQNGGRIFPRDGLSPTCQPLLDKQEQLVNEVKGIYAGLVMVEKKCVEIDQQQSQTTSKLSNEQWRALIALHRTLLHEHHDFFLASQHPSSSPALVTKYAMPARMWKHGIHSFLELLRHRLPDSLEETWIGCLGDLARYRMAIEEVDLRDREAWPGVARMWYDKAADRSPTVGRIQHDLAVLARLNIVSQLFHYSKALKPRYDDWKRRREAELKDPQHIDIVGGSKETINVFQNIGASFHCHCKDRIVHRLEPCQCRLTSESLPAETKSISEPQSLGIETDAERDFRDWLRVSAIKAEVIEALQNLHWFHDFHFLQILKPGWWSETVLHAKSWICKRTGAFFETFADFAFSRTSVFVQNLSLVAKIFLVMDALPVTYAAPPGSDSATANQPNPEAWLDFETMCHIIGWASTSAFGALVIYFGLRRPRRDLAHYCVLSFGAAGASLVLLDARAPPEVGWPTACVGFTFLVRFWMRLSEVYDMGHGWLGPILGLAVLLDVCLIHWGIGQGGDQGLFLQLLLTCLCLALSICTCVARFHRHINAERRLEEIV